MPPPRCSSATFRFMSPTHTQPPPGPEPASLVLTAHLEWSRLALNSNVFPGFICVTSRTFHPSEQSEGRTPEERTQNWTRRSDWRAGATHPWYRSNEGQMEDDGTVNIQYCEEKTQCTFQVTSASSSYLNEGCTQKCSH